MDENDKSHGKERAEHYLLDVVDFLLYWGLHRLLRELGSEGECHGVGLRPYRMILLS